MPTVFWRTPCKTAKEYFIKNIAGTSMLKGRKLILKVTKGAGAVA
jgi:hypothetical protein